ncbi:MAG: carbohydrate kinase [Chitinophagaceae bacterium]|nr:carbohydrate kinase [Chitinophagaceae bacterium]
MQKKPVVAILDVGKTNKKLLLFDQSYQLVYEKSDRMEETVDEDGFACEDLASLTSSAVELIKSSLHLEEFEVKAINFTAYGASFVYIDGDGKTLTPLYNYLKPYPQDLQHDFYEKYGGGKAFSRCTASPVLGSLNSGMQVLRIKHEQPEIFASIAFALHLPQYLSYIFTDLAVTDITSIGCHTNLWDFTKQTYHDWVQQEGIAPVLAPIISSAHVEKINIEGQELYCGIGLHDSSSALIPYLICFKHPFVLVSTGTWSISLNPFDHVPLTDEELQKDCLCYLQFTGKPVKASRLFLGNEHEKGAERIASHYAIPADFYKSIRFDQGLSALVRERMLSKDFSSFEAVDLMELASPDLAYNILIAVLVKKQIESIDLILKHQDAENIFVDGGFSKNHVFMSMLASHYNDKKVYAAEVAQATALGAALAINDAWNPNTVGDNLINLKLYS